jgi:class 3 adenylate cyclase
MSDTDSLLTTLRQSADPDAAAAIEQLVRDGSDRALNRINVLDFAGKRGLDEERAIAAFLHAARLGMFDLSWNVLCPSCGGVFDSNATLTSVDRDHYNCAFCAAGYEPMLDETIEVTFTVNPRIRKIAAHDPNTLPIWEYYHQIFWSSGVDLPDIENFARQIQDVTLDSVELPPGEKALLSLQLPAASIIVFDPVTHTAQFFDVKGETTRERQHSSLVFDKIGVPTGTTTLQPGPLRLAMENRSEVRVLPAVWVAADPLNALIGKRKPFLTANRLLSNQTFRDIYRTGTLNIDQRLKITSLTFLFTDLKGSTELYERVGDLVAFDLVRAHFRIVLDIVAAAGGAVVKTIGDAVMATFPTPEKAVGAALRMREAMDGLNAERQGENLALKIGIHEGPCLAVILNDRQDYFGQTVNIAARVQNRADSRAILATGSVVDSAETVALLAGAGLKPESRRYALRGIADELTLYAIP